MTKHWQFRPPWWAVLGTAFGCALTMRLGWWQWQRGVDKEALDAQYASASAAGALALRRDTPVRAGAEAIAARATGHYDGARQLLLDNQVHERTPGYQVLTPFVLASGGLVLVNRGWIAQNPDRRVLPALPVPEDRTLSVRGLWRSLPEPALRLAADNCGADPSAPWPRIVDYPTVSDLGCLYGPDVADGVLLLDPDAPEGYVRHWQQFDRQFPPEKHYGYAAQWFAFCATLLAIFVKLNLKRRPIPT